MDHTPASFAFLPEDGRGGPRPSVQTMRPSAASSFLFPFRSRTGGLLALTISVPHNLPIPPRHLTSRPLARLSGVPRRRFRLSLIIMLSSEY